MKGLKYCWSVSLVLLLISCAGKSVQEQNNQDVLSQVTATNKEADLPNLTNGSQKFPFPEIPVVLVQSDERKKFLLEHYWDRFNFADTVLVNNRDLSEQGLANQLSLLADKMTGEGLITKSIDNLCTGMEQQEYACKIFMGWIEDYLYNANSPFCNESIYRIYLQRMLMSKTLDETRKSSLKFQLELINRNQVGRKAETFIYYLPDNTQSSLDRTLLRGDYLLLLFYDPECTGCHEVLKDMANDRELAAAVVEGRLTVLAVYTEDNEEIWKRTLVDMPKNWLVAHDRQTVKENALYDLKAMPSLYLLDNHKRVILKDTSYKAIKEYLGI